MHGITYLLVWSAVVLLVIWLQQWTCTETKITAEAVNLDTATAIGSIC